MIPREILKKIRQIKLRTNRIVSVSAARGLALIPTGFRPKAQGYEERASMGQRPTNHTNAVAAIPISPIARGICLNPVGVDEKLIPFTQGSSFVATLGYMTQSLWDSPNRADSSFIIQPSSFLSA
jgi:hypothetical protein